VQSSVHSRVWMALFYEMPPAYIWDGVVDDFTNAFLTSFAMILFSETGDKTFLITAIMSMKHARWLIFASALTSLTLMTLISVGVGMFLFHFVPIFYTKIISCILFGLFGLIMLIEGCRMPHQTTGAELQIVCDEIEASRLSVLDITPSTVSIDILPESSPMIATHASLSSQAGSPASRHSRLPYSPPHSSTRLIQPHTATTPDPSFTEDEHGLVGNPAAATTTDCLDWLAKFKRLLKLALSPTFLQLFIMVFLAEWGDRSQFSTIALAASKVTFYSLYEIWCGSKSCPLSVEYLWCHIGRHFRPCLLLWRRCPWRTLPCVENFCQNK
jgi:Ca2+/H+ antiporter, TMEM165/GDT1 family